MHLLCCLLHYSPTGCSALVHVNQKSEKSGFCAACTEAVCMGKLKLFLLDNIATVFNGRIGVPHVSDTQSWLVSGTCE